MSLPLAVTAVARDVHLSEIQEHVKRCVKSMPSKKKRVVPCCPLLIHSYSRCYYRIIRQQLGTKKRKLCEAVTLATEFTWERKEPISIQAAYYGLFQFPVNPSHSNNRDTSLGYALIGWNLRIRDGNQGIFRPVIPCASIPVLISRDYSLKKKRLAVHSITFPALVKCTAHTITGTGKFTIQYFQGLG